MIKKGESVIESQNEVKGIKENIYTREAIKRKRIYVKRNFN